MWEPTPPCEREWTEEEREEFFRNGGSKIEPVKLVFKVGQIYRNNAPGATGWCKHGLVEIVETSTGIWAFDTYWGDRSGEGVRPGAIVDHLTFVIDREECRIGTCDEYEIYADADRCNIPIGGIGEKFLIRKDARPDPERQRGWIKRRIESLRSDISFAENNIARLTEELSRIPIQPNSHGGRP